MGDMNRRAFLGAMGAVAAMGAVSSAGVAIADDFVIGEANVTTDPELEALGQSATVAAQGAQSVAQKLREVLEAGLREASTLAREYKPLGKVQENLALQTEFARKMFDIAVKGAQDSASTAWQSTSDAVKIIQDLMKESFEEFRASVRPNKSA